MAARKVEEGGGAGEGWRQCWRRRGGGGRSGIAWVLAKWGGGGGGEGGKVRVCGRES